VKLRIGLLGLGVMGRQHFRLIPGLDDANLVAVCDESIEASEWVATNSSVPVFDDWRKLLTLEIDAIVNALPTGFHYEVTRAFLENGIHVLVEKPIATSVPEAEQLADIATRHGVVLMVGHVERFNPMVEALRQLIASDRLGSIVSVSARRVGVARPTVPFANVVLDLAIHDIDVLAYLLNTCGRLLLATGARLGSNLLSDHADLMVRYGSATASIQANWITPVKIRRLTVTGTSGFVEADYVDQTIRLFETVPEVIKGTPSDFFAVSRESDALDIRVPRYEPLLAELEHFVTCIRAGSTPRTDAASATEALALAVEATRVIQGLTFHDSKVSSPAPADAASGHL
jgi:UDP-N-acetylglucosamine 3-dehydrogenase